MDDHLHKKTGMSCYFRTVSLGICLIALVGCTKESSINWRLVFEDLELESRTVGIYAQIVGGSCSDASGHVLYDVQFQGDQGPAPQQLDTGYYAFSATAYDENCVAFASGCEQELLPIEGSGEITVVLRAVTEVSTCAGHCDSGECTDFDADADIEDADIEDADIEAGEADVPDAEEDEDPFSYRWEVGTSCATECTQACDSGTCILDAWCEREDGVIVGDTNCSGQRPEIEEPCNTHPCCFTDHLAMEADTRCDGTTSDIIEWQWNFHLDDGSLENRRVCAEQCTEWANEDYGYNEWCCDLSEENQPGEMWICAAHRTLGIEELVTENVIGTYAVVGGCD